MPFPDYVEFIALLNEHRVKYLIVGAQALAYHARPRATKDLDLFIEPKRANAKRVLEALKSFFKADTGYEVDDLIAAKEAADRPQDRADVRVLKKARDKQGRSKP